MIRKLLRSKLNILFVLLMFGVSLNVNARKGRIKLSPVVDTVLVHSASMNKDIKAVVVTPQKYAFDKKDVRYPVVYLLHGYSGCYSDWISKYPRLKAMAKENNVIIVCPDGQDSWYYDSPVDSTMRFETYIVNELVPYIDSKYRTIATPEGRAITGLSMGGHGAMWLGLRHQDLFRQCGTMSGGVDVTAFPEKWKIKNRLGNYEENKNVWKSHSVAEMIPNITINKDQRIIIDCGIDDFMMPVNNKLHQVLVDCKIPHDFTVRPGKHTWVYWCNSLEYHMLFFKIGFNSKRSLDRK